MEQMLAVIVLQIDVQSLKELLNSETSNDGLGESGELLVATQEGTEIQYIFPTLATQRLKVDAEKVPDMVKAIQGEQGFDLGIYDGVSSLLYYQPVEYQDPAFRRWGWWHVSMPMKLMHHSMSYETVCSSCISFH